MPRHAEAVQEPDFGGASWFGPPGPSFEPTPFATRAPGAGNAGTEDTVVGDWPPVGGTGPRDPAAGPYAEPAPSREPPRYPEARVARSETAAHLWAEVTRGGTPAGVNPNRGGNPLANRLDDAPHGMNSGSPWRSTHVPPEDAPFGPDEFAPGEFATGEDDVLPFRGARRVDVSAAKAAPARRPSVNGRPSAGGTAGDGADSASIWKPRRPESGAFRRIRDTGAMRAIMDTNAMRTLMDTAAMQILRDRFAGRGRLIASVAIVAWVSAAVAGIVVLASSNGNGTPKASPSTAATVRASAVGTGQPSPGPSASPSRTTVKAKGKTAGPATVLSVASAQAFGPSGTSDGDNSDLAESVISGDGTRSWHTKWYATAHFGNLQSGTGLLLDMGKTVTVTKVTLELAAGGADVTIRVGNTPGALTKIADGTGVGGTVSLPAATPASGRYVEVWFSSLPEDSTGTYQESVYGVQVTGQA